MNKKILFLVSLLFVVVAINSVVALCRNSEGYYYDCGDNDYTYYSGSSYNYYSQIYSYDRPTLYYVDSYRTNYYNEYNTDCCPSSVNNPHYFDSYTVLKRTKTSDDCYNDRDYDYSYSSRCSNKIRLSSSGGCGSRVGCYDAKGYDCASQPCISPYSNYYNYNSYTAPLVTETKVVQKNQPVTIYIR